MKFKDPTRYVNDTFPMLATIELDGDCIDITEDTIYFYYNEITDSGSKLIKIEAIQINSPKGQIAIYPKINYSYDITDILVPVNYVPFTIPGVFDYSIVSTKVIYDLYDNGEYVLINNEYIEYDETKYTGMQRYNKFIEKHTYAVGKITILDRVGE